MPKKGFRVGNLENYCHNKTQHPRYTMGANFQSKWTTLNFSVEISPKLELRFKIQKNNVATRIRNLEMTCVPFFTRNKQLWLFWSKFAQKWILRSELQKFKSGFGINILGILCAPSFRQNGQLWYFGSNFAREWILGSEFQKSKSGFGINTSNIPCALIFSQNGQPLIFWSKFEEIAPLRAIFWF